MVLVFGSLELKRGDVLLIDNTQDSSGTCVKN